MDEEIERGRIEGLRRRRIATAEWAETLIPFFAEAREVLPEYGLTGRPSNAAYARWLNHSDRKVPARKGGEWCSEKVDRLFNLHIGLCDNADLELEVNENIYKFKMNYIDMYDINVVERELMIARERHSAAISSALKLAASLRGEPVKGFTRKVPITSAEIRRRDEFEKLTSRVQLLECRFRSQYNHAISVLYLLQLHVLPEDPMLRSDRGIADWLNAGNFKNFNGKCWRQQTVADLFDIASTLIRTATFVQERQESLHRFGMPRKTMSNASKIALEDLEIQILQSKIELANRRKMALMLAEQYDQLRPPKRPGGLINRRSETARSLQS